MTEDARARPPTGRPRALVAGAAAQLAALVLVGGAVGAAIALPDTSTFDAVDRGTALSYDGTITDIRPLDEAFVRSLLGLAPLASVGPDAGSPTSASIRGADLPTGSGGQPAVRRTNHDQIDDALIVDTLPFRATTDTSGASRSPDEPDDCGSVGPTVWYRWTPTRATTALIAAEAGDAVTTLGLFTGVPGALEAQDCVQGLAGQVGVRLVAEPGQTVWLQLSSVRRFARATLVIEEVGTVARVLTDDGLHMAFSEVEFTADGSEVAIWTQYPLDPRDRKQPRVYVSGVNSPDMNVYVIDLLDGTAELIDVRMDGSMPMSAATGLDMTPDGRFVVFASRDDQLVPGDTNGDVDIFVRDRLLQTTDRVSVFSDGSEGKNPVCLAGPLSCWQEFDPESYHMEASISDDGNVVAFSTALTLDEDDTTWQYEVGRPWTLPLDPDTYVHDRRTGETRLVLRNPNGSPIHDAFHSAMPNLSADGNVLVLVTDAPLDPERDPEGGQTPLPDHHPDRDLYRVDLRTNEYTLVTASVAGKAGEESGDPYPPVITPDGRFIAFVADRDDLVAEDTNEMPDAFVYDHRTGVVERVSVSTEGRQQAASTEVNEEANLAQRPPRISDDGRFVAFKSAGVGLSPHDRQRTQNAAFTSGENSDVFLRDRLLGTTTMLSLAADGSTPEAGTLEFGLSPSGRTAILASAADLAGDGHVTYDDDGIIEYRSYLIRLGSDG